ncbi:MAG: hypothetical protein AAF764_00815 [Pseudomonadota bacterium]
MPGLAATAPAVRTVQASLANKVFMITSPTMEWSRAFHASSEQQAVCQAFADEFLDWDDIEDEDGNPFETKEAAIQWAIDNDYGETVRMPEWEGLGRPIDNADWAAIGYTTVCNRCNDGSYDEGLECRAVGREAVCEDCLHLGDQITLGWRDEVVEAVADQLMDAEYLRGPADPSAMLIVVRDLHKHGFWWALPDDWWEKACRIHFGMLEIEAMST